MTQLPASRLPDPLTEKALEGMIRDPRYWHPQRRDPAFQQMVSRGFQLLYPGMAQYDATGRMIRPVPREGRLADLERAAGTGSGEVHVQAYTRQQGDQVVQVDDYTRAAPGHGAGGNAAAGTAKPPLATKEKIEALRKTSKAEWNKKTIQQQQCVALVKEALPRLGATPNWKPGQAIKGPNDPPLEYGTPIATFNKKGVYESKDTGNHAAIFLGYTEGGIKVLDQAEGRPPEEREIRFNRPKSLSASRRAEAFSVILPRN